MINELTKVKGIGVKTQEKLNTLDIHNVKDLLLYYPRQYLDRTKVINISQIEENSYVSLKGVISNISSKYMPYGRRLHITNAIFKDETGEINLTWFNQSYLSKVLRNGSFIYLFGKAEKKGFFYSLTNPEFSFKKEDFIRIEPVYPKNTHIAQYEIRKSIKSALDYTGHLIKETLPEDVRKKYNLMDKELAIKNIHYPSSPKAFYDARRRLVFEELFLMQLALFTIKENNKVSRKGNVYTNSNVANTYIKNLPFTLTNGQVQAIKDIDMDLKSGKLMSRLLQGDVGSGKTLVSFYAVLKVFEKGDQSALMVPTEILAKQHFENAQKDLSPLGVRCLLLVGSLSKKEKEEAYSKIENGQVDLVIGTHALIQKDVKFKNLTLCITDEQHRFGVSQRTEFSQKGRQPHLLVMSATPIPRTLALVIYGDLDISTIKEMPKERKKVLTYAVDESYRQRIIAFIEKIVNQGQQVYIVCPSIYENPDIDISDVTTKFEFYSKNLPKLKVDVLHGQMKNKEKSEIINDFLDKKSQVLVTTTIIEVGIDIANAGLIVIEDAQQFGLSQLHQLRGRVGRSNIQAYCILFNQSESENAKKRMDAMVSSNDGFYLAEEDLALRGPGDFFGVKQHGLPEFKIANLYEDMDILKLTQKALVDEIKRSECYKNLLEEELLYIGYGNL